MKLRIFYLSLLLSIVAVIYFYSATLSALAMRNLGMKQLEYGYLSPANHPIDQSTLINRLYKDIEANPQRSLSWARYASALKLVGQDERARLFAQTAVTMDGNQLCQRNENDFVRLISDLRKTTFPSLPFSHLHTYWLFQKNDEANGTLQYSLSPTNSVECQAQIVYNFAPQPNRFLILWHNVNLKANTTYKLAAFVKAHGITDSWFGIASQWHGQEITNSSTWQSVTYVFHTDTVTDVETIQFVIGGGQGQLNLRDVRLIELD